MLYEMDVAQDTRFVVAMERSLGSFEHASELEAACDAVVQATGKLLRPRILLTMAGAGQDGPVSDEIIDAAVAVEFLHLASLAHDDVVDNADIRRSRPAVQATFGATAAVLAGGWLFSRGLALVSSLGPDVAEAYARAASDMCAGQMLEVEEAGDVSRTEERYFAAVTGKTAALFTWASRTGAILAGLPGPQVEQAARFGTEFGVAYQIIDDILDITATEEQLGKPAHGDVRAGIYTLPLIHAMASDATLADRLEGPLDASEIQELVAVVRAGGAVTTAREEARRRLGCAREALGHVPHAAQLALVVDDVEAMLDRIADEHA